MKKSKSAKVVSTTVAGIILANGTNVPTLAKEIESEIKSIKEPSESIEVTNKETEAKETETKETEAKETEAKEKEAERREAERREAERREAERREAKEREAKEREAKEKYKETEDDKKSDKNKKDNETVNIPDKNLLEAINKALKVEDKSSEITVGQMKSLKGTLDLSSKGIKNIEGIQYAVNVKEFILSKNNITDISPIKPLLGGKASAILIDNQIIKEDKLKNKIKYINNETLKGNKSSKSVKSARLSFIKLDSVKNTKIYFSGITSANEAMLINESSKNSFKNERSFNESTGTYTITLGVGESMPLLDPTVCLDVKTAVVKTSEGKVLDETDYENLVMNFGFSNTIDLSESESYEIPDYAFNAMNDSLVKFKFPKKLERIGHGAFESCINLTGSLEIPSGVVEIGNSAFYECIGLNGTLTIPDKVTSIGAYAFEGCSGFSELKLPNSIETIGSGVFMGCSGFSGTLTIPGSVTTIGSYAFEGCSGFSGTLTIPDSVTTIGSYAFMGCSGFSGLKISNSLRTIDTGVFEGCSGFSGTLTIPSKVRTIGSYAFQGCSGFSGSLTIPNSVTSIKSFTFNGCSGFSGSLTIPDSVANIGAYAFQGCSGFNGTLTIPNKVTSIGAYAFNECSGLNGTLTIPNKVTSIGDYAFRACSQLKGDVLIPNSVTSVGYSPFDKCDGIDRIIIPVDQSHSVSNYKKSLFDKISEGTKMCLEMPYDFDESGTWIASTSYQKLKPTIKKHYDGFKEDENISGDINTSVALSMPTSYKVENVSVLKDGISITPQISGNKLIFSQKGTYSVNVTTDLGINSTINFEIKSRVNKPSIKISGNRLSLIDNKTTLIDGVGSNSQIIYKNSKSMQYSLNGGAWINYTGRVELPLNAGDNATVRARSLYDDDQSDVEEKTFVVEDFVNIPDENFLRYINEKLGNGPITDKVTKSEMDSITYYDINEDTNIRSIEGIQHSTKVTNLYITSPDINDLTPLRSMNLESLDILELISNKIQNLEVIRDKNLSKLTSLYLGGDTLTDLSVLETNNINKLHTIAIYENRIQDISPIINLDLTQLGCLMLTGGSIRNINDLRNVKMDSLQELGLCNFGFEDLSFVLSLQTGNLTTLDLSDNKITDISDIKNSTFDNLIILGLRNNEIESIDPIRDKELYLLDVGENRIKDLSLSASTIGTLVALHADGQRIKSEDAKYVKNQFKVNYGIKGIDGRQVETVHAYNGGKLVGDEVVWDNLSSNEDGEYNLKYLFVQDIGNALPTRMDEKAKSKLLNSNVLKSRGLDPERGSVFSGTYSQKVIIDNTLPTINLEYDASPTNKDIDVSISASDATSGVKSITLPDGEVVSGNEAIFKFTNNDTYTFKVEDGAGNILTETVSVTNIDKDTPNIEYSLDKGSMTNSNITGTISFSDAGLGIKSIKLHGQDKETIQNAPLTLSRQFTFTSNGRYRFEVEDIAGNTFNREIAIANIDREKPVITITLDNTNPTKNNVNANIVFEDRGSAIKSVKLHNQAEKSVSNTPFVHEENFTITSNGTYSFKVTDHAGNETTKSVTVSNIDKSAPSIQITPSVTNPTNGDVILSLSFKDTGLGIKSINVNSETEELISTNPLTLEREFLATANGTYSFKVTDIAGNTFTKDYVVSNIDKDKPSISYILNNTNLTKDNVTGTISFIDRGLGIKSIKLHGQDREAISNGTMSLERQFTFTSNGDYTFEVTDMAGNTTQKVVTVTNIDKEAPSITYQLDNTNPTKESVNGVITFVDNGFGVKSIKLHGQSVQRLQNPTKSVTRNYTFVSNGSYTFEVEDLAGNKHAKVITISNIDKENSTIDIALDNTNPTNKNVTATATFRDAGLGIKSIKLPGQAVQNISNAPSEHTASFSIVSNGTYEFVVTDIAGNETRKSITVSNIDKDNPNVQITPNTTNPTKNNVELTANFSDLGLGIKSVKVHNQSVETISGNPTSLQRTLSVSANGTYTFVVTDMAGNEVSKSITVSNIDKEVPTIEYTLDKTGPTNTDVIGNLVFTDSGLGIKSIKLDGSSEEMISGAPSSLERSFTFSSNRDYNFIVTDVAGNTFTKTVTISNIDKSVPYITHTLDNTSPTNNNVTGSIVFKDDGFGLKSIKLHGKSAENITSGSKLETRTFIFTSNGTYTFEVTNLAGTTSSHQITISNIDKSNPTIDYTLDNTNPTNGDVTASLTFKDTGIGLKYIRLNGSQIENITGDLFTALRSYKFTSNGNYVFEAEDLAGNKVSKTITITNIDKDKPSISYTLDKTEPTKDSVTGTIKFKDTGFGIKSIKLHGKSLENISSSPSSLERSFTFTSNGNYTFEVTDIVGNTYSEVISISNIDKVGPSIAYTVDKTEPTKDNVVGLITFTDEGLGIKSITLAGQNKEDIASSPESISRTYTFTANGVYTFKVEDMAGNVTTKTITISNIDKTNATVDIVLSNANPTKNNVTATATFRDSGLGIKSIQMPGKAVQTLSDSPSEYVDSVTLVSNGTYEFLVTDMAGNETTKSITISNIDKTNPDIQIIPSTTNPTKGDVNLTVNFSDVGLGIKSVKLHNQSAETVSANPLSLQRTLTVSSNGTYSFVVTDVAGNEISKSITVSNIDKSIPTILCTLDKTDLTNKDVNGRLVFSDEGLGIKSIKLHGASEEIITGAPNSVERDFVFSSNGDYSFIVTDIAGNTFTKTVSISNINKIAPTITYSLNNTSPTNQSVVGAIVFNDSIGIKSIKLHGMEAETLSLSSTRESREFTFTSNGTYTFEVTNTSGTKVQKNIVVSNIDKAKPTIEHSLSESNPTNGNVTGTISFKDSDSGIKSIKLHGMEVENISGSLASIERSYNFTANGNYVFEVTDMAGNTFTKTITISNIDKIRPTINHVLDKTEVTKDNVVATIGFVDTGLGIKSIKLHGQEVENISNAPTSLQRSFTFANNGDYTFEIIDLAGNKHTKVITISNIDKVVPDIEYQLNNINPTNQDVTAMIVFSDRGSGLKSVKLHGQEVEIIQAPTEFVSKSYTFKANGTYTFEVEDLVGNKTTKVITISNIDKTNSTIDVTLDNANPTNGNVNASVLFKDNELGIKSIQMPGKTLQNIENAPKVYNDSITITSNGVYEFLVIDVAGNETRKSITVSNIDKTNPSIQITPNTTNPTKGNVTLTANFSDLGLGIKSVKVHNQNVETISGNPLSLQRTLSVGANGTYTFVVTDMAGNETTKSITVSNIDKEVPNIECALSTTEPTNENVTGRLVFTDNGLGIKSITLDGSSEEIISGAPTSIERSFVFTANRDYNFVVKDLAGNTFTKTITISNIDKNAPYITYTLDKTGPTKDSITASMVFKDDGLGIKSIKLHGQDEEILTNNSNEETREFVFKNNGIYTFEVINKAGTKIVQEIVITNIDKTMPTIEHSLSEVNPTNGNVIGTIIFKDSGLGLKSIKLNGSNIENITGDLSTAVRNYTFTNNGSYVFEATDLAGNKYSKTIVISNIDKAKPTINCTLNNTNPTKENVVGTISFADSGLGIKSIKLHNGTVENLDNSPKSLERSFTFENNGDYVFEATDIAGNTYSKIVTISNIDKIGPKVECMLDNTKPTKDNVNGVLTFTDEGLGIKSITLHGEEEEVISGSPKSLTRSYVFKMNGSYTFKVEDMSGNISTKVVNISNIDKTYSTIDILLDNTNPVNKNVNATATFRDSGLGIKSIQMPGKTLQNLDNAPNVHSESMSITSNGVYEFLVIDMAGNETRKSVTVSNIDKIQPSIEINQNVVNPTNGNVLLNVKFADIGFGIKSIKLHNQQVENVTGSPSSLEREFTVSANGTYSFIVTDMAGNEMTKSVTVSNIDKTNPSIDYTLSETGPTSLNVVADINFTDIGLGIKSVKLHNRNEEDVYGSPLNISKQFTFTTNGTYNFVVKDLAGNTFTKTITISNIDKEKPTINHVLNNTNPTKGNVTGVISFSDSGLGIKSIKLHGQALENISNSPSNLEREFTFTSNGDYIFEVTDMANNTTQKVITVTNIDKVVPGISYSLDNTKPVNEDVNGVITFTDEGLGIKSITLHGEEKEVISSNQSTLTRNYVFRANGNYTFEVEDLAGNKYSKVITISNIDKVSSTINIELDNTNPTNKNIEAVLTFRDVGLGIKSVQLAGQSLKNIENNPNEYIENYTITSNGVYEFLVIDVAGNETRKSITVSNIDKAVPVIEVNQNIVNPTTSNVLLNVKFSDIGFGIKSIKLHNQNVENISGAPLSLERQFTVNSNGTYTFVVTDIAGNEITKNVVVSNIDKINPQIDYTLSQTNPTSTNVNANISFSDVGLGIKSIKIHDQREELIADSPARLDRTFVIESNGSYDIKVTDMAGNTVTKTITVDNIDKVTPTINYTLDEINPTKNNVIGTISFVDVGLGIKSIKLHGQALESVNNSPSSLERQFTFTSNGDYTFEVTDMAGNTTQKVVTVTNIDKVAPNISYVVDKTTPTTENVKGVIKFTDSGLGIKSVKLHGKNEESIAGAPLSLDKEFVFTNNGEYTFVVTDLVGNTFSKVITISNIDRTTPSIDCSLNTTNPTKSNVVGTVTFRSEGFGLGSIKLPGVETEALASNPKEEVRQFTFTTNGTYVFEAENAAGTKITKEIVISNIDKEVPTIECTLDETNPTNKNVIGAIVFKDKGFGIKNIKLDGRDVESITGDLSSVTRVYTFTENRDYVFEVEDLAGNKYSKTVKITNIDKVKPNISYVLDKTYPTSQDVNADITFTDSGLGIKSIKMHGQSTEEISGAPKTLSKQMTFSTNGSYSFEITDLAGNTFTQVIEVSNIDKVNPTIVHTLSQTNPTNADVIGNITFEDKGLGIKSITMNGTKEVLDTPLSYLNKQFTFKTNGSYVFKVEDMAGNIDTKTITISNIDKTKAQIAVELDNTNPTNENVNAKITFTDVGLGIKSVKIHDQEEKNISSNPSEHIENFTIVSNGVYEFVVTDIAGNETVKSITVSNIDKEVPGIEISPSNINPTNKDVTLRVKFTDVGLGIKNIKLHNQNVEVLTGAPNLVERELVVSANGTYSFSVTDIVGNEITKSIVVSNIDKNVPTIEYTLDKVNPTNTDVVADITFEDVGLGIKSIKMHTQSEEIIANMPLSVNRQYTFTTNGSYDFVVTDLAGNKFTKTITVSNIDKNVPTITHELNRTGPTKDNVTAAVTFTDGGFGIKSLKLHGQDKEVLTSHSNVETREIVFTENGTYDFEVENIAGTKVSYQIVITNIDKEVPTIEYSLSELNPTNNNVMGSIVFKDKGIGLKSIKLDGMSAEVVNGDLFTAARTYTFTENRNYVFEVEDLAGNKYSKTIKITNIDKVKPTISYELSETNPTNENVVGNIRFNDEHLGIKSVKLHGKDVENIDNAANALEREFIFETNGDYIFEVVDMAGNTYSEVITISNIDKEIPTIAYQVDKTQPTNTNVEAMITFEDRGLGLKSIKLHGQDKENIPGGQSGVARAYTFRANGTYTFEVEDAAGNKITKAVTISNIDKVNSTIDIALDKTNHTNTNVEATVTFRDIGLGIKSIQMPGKSIKNVDGALSEYIENYTITTNGEYEFVVIDIAGNETRKSITVTNIDKAVPSINIAPSTTSPTNEDVTLNVRFTDSGLGIKSIKLNTQEVEAIENSPMILDKEFIVKENGTYSFTVTDIGGNEITKEIVVSNIDKKVPKISYVLDKTTPTNKDVIGDITFTDEGLGIKSIKLHNQSKENIIDVPLNISRQFVFERNGRYDFIVTDLAGNEFVETINITNIDKGVPKIEYVLDELNPTNKDVVAQITFKDDGLFGIKNIKLHGKDVEAVRGSEAKREFIFSSNGTYEFEIENIAGTKVTKVIEITNIDKTKPYIEYVLEETNPTNKNVHGKITFKDDGLGIKSVKMHGQDEETFTGKLSSVTKNFTFVQNGDYLFEIEDVAGNKCTETITISNIDKTNPNIRYSLNNTNPTNHDVIGKIVFEDIDLGIKSIKLHGQEVEAISGAPNELEREYAFKLNGEYVFEVEDLAGNKFLETINITNIDKVKPQITYAVDKTYPTNEDVIATVSFSDEGFGIKSVSLDGEIEDINNTPASLQREYTFNENGEYVVAVEDLAGNITTETIVITNIDKTNPEIRVDIGNLSPTNENVNAAVTFTDVGLGIKSIQLPNQEIKDVADAPKTYTESFTFVLNGTYEFKVIDLAGNITTKEVVISNIDKVVPQMEYTLSTLDHTNKDVVGNIKFTDSGLGIKSIKLHGQNVENINANPDTVTREYVFTSNGDYVFEVEDLAGNKYSRTITITNIDKVKPTINYSLDINDKTNLDVVGTFVFEDDYSTIKSIQLHGEEPQVFDYGVKSVTRNFAFTKNGRYEFKIEDYAGNAYTEVVDIVNIDKVKPQIEYEVDTTDPISGDVNGVIKFSDVGFGIKSIKLNGKNEDIKKAPNELERKFVFETNGSYVFEVVDIVGNRTTKTIEITNIDKVNPEVSYHISNADITNKDIDLTLVFKDVGLGIKSINMNGEKEDIEGQPKSLERVFTVEANGEYTFTVEDMAGNEDTVTVNIENIDKHQPVIAFDVDRATPTNQDLVANVTFSNAGHGIRYIKMDGVEEEIQGNTKTVTREFVFKENGEYEFEVTNIAGTTTTEVLKIENIDKVIPFIEYEVDNLNPTNESVNAVVKFTDKGLGVKQITLNNKVVPATTEGSNEVIRDFVFDKNGEYEFEVEDMAGNKFSKMISVSNIDKTRPVIKVSVDNLEPTNQDVNSNISIIDEGLGLEYVMLPDGRKIDIKSKKLYELAYTFEKNGTYEFVARDKAGNTTIKIVNISNIFKENPEVSYKMESLKQDGDEIIITVKEGEVDIDYVILPNGEKIKGSRKVRYLVTKSGEYKFKFVDLVGNETELVVPVEIKTNKTNSPKTGDEMSVLASTSILGASIVALTGALNKKNKKKK